MVMPTLGKSFQSMGLVNCSFYLEQWQYTFDFIVCKHLQKPLILDIKFLKQHRTGTSWSNSGKFFLNQDNQVCIE